LAVVVFATDRIADRALDVRHECGLHQLLVAPSDGMAERFAQAMQRIADLEVLHRFAKSVFNLNHRGFSCSVVSGCR